MICDLIFKVGGKEILLTVESESPTYPTDSEIIEALKNPINAKQREELYTYIEENYDIRENQPLDVEDLFKDSNGNFCMPNGLVGNTTVQQLAMLYPNAKFPEGIDAKVLAVNNLKVGGKTISGRCITSNGEELFIINTEEDIDKLAGFLTIRNILNENPNYYDKDSKYYNNLEAIRIQFNKSSIQELILDFIELSKPKQESKMNENTFRTTYFTNSNGQVESVYEFLDKISRDIQQYNQRVQYSDGFVNAISKLHRDRKDDIKAIKYNELFATIQAFHPELLTQLNADTLTKFKNRIKETDFNTDLFETVIEGKPLLYTLFYFLTKNEKRYQYEAISNTNDEIKIKWKYHNIRSLFGFNYETIHTFDLIDQDYKGYKIYKFNYNGEPTVIYSRNYLTENTTIHKQFKTVDEAKKYINKKILNEKLKTNSFLRFKFRIVTDKVQDNSKYIYYIENPYQQFSTGSIVETLDIPINPATQLQDDEKQLKDSMESTLQDFYNLVNKWQISEDTKNTIINKIDNSEKAITFIYKINEKLGFERTNETELINIANKIASCKKIAYYINSKTDNGYTLIPTKPNDIKKWKKDKSIPVVQLLDAIRLSLESRFGVKVNLLTSSQIAETFPNIDSNRAKAFIYNGEIYVNTTIASGEDLLHEYTHITLGILKANPKSRTYYEQLVNNVWKLAKKEDREQAQKDYGNILSMDVKEELFARKFAEHLLKNRNDNLNEIFQQQKEYLKECVKTIFDLLGNESLETTYSRSINSVFRRFSSDIETLLQSGADLDLELITNSRRKETFLRKQISDGKITGIC